MWVWKAKPAPPPPIVEGWMEEVLHVVVNEDAAHDADHKLHNPSQLTQHC